MIVTVKRGAEERCFFHIFFVKKKLDLSPRSMSMQYRRALSVGELPQNLRASFHGTSVGLIPSAPPATQRFISILADRGRTNPRSKLTCQFFVPPST